MEILVFAEASLLQWAGYDVNLPAGLEDALIKAFEPEWNRTLPKTRTDYSDLVELPDEKELEENQAGKELTPSARKCLFSFEIQLGETYYNTGFINPGTDASERMGAHGEPVTIYLGSKGNSLTSTINRQTNVNRSVRIVGNNGQIRDWFQARFKQGDIVQACVLNPNEIFLWETPVSSPQSNAGSLAHDPIVPHG